MNARNSDFITETRAAKNEIIEGINKLRNLRREFNYSDLNNQLNNGTRDPQDDDATRLGDFQGRNADVTKDGVVAVIGTTLDALEALLDSGHGTNLYKI